MIDVLKLAEEAEDIADELRYGNEGQREIGCLLTHLAQAVRAMAPVVEAAQASRDFADDTGQCATCNQYVDPTIGRRHCEEPCPGLELRSALDAYDLALSTPDGAKGDGHG
jgi:hypothetical protein